MDLTRAVTFRSFLLNDPDIQDSLTTPAGGVGHGIVGCAMDSADISDVDVVQFVEKRSQTDGMDAGVPSLGTRRIRMAGTLYHTSRPELYDQLNSLRAALSPVLSYRESPLDYGYQPLYYSIPTARTDLDEYPGGVIDLRILCLPRSFQASFQRDSHGGNDNDSLAIPWQATFVTKDPTIQAAERQEYDLSTASPVVGNFINRGNYIAPLNMLIATGAAAGTITVTAGDSLFTLTIPASTGDRIIRFKGEDKVVTIEEDDVELPRMGVLNFSGDTTWPLISTGTTAFSVAFTGVTHTAGSVMWFYERYA